MEQCAENVTDWDCFATLTSVVTAMRPDTTRRSSSGKYFVPTVFPRIERKGEGAESARNEDPLVNSARLNIDR